MDSKTEIKIIQKTFYPYAIFYARCPYSMADVQSYDRVSFSRKYTYLRQNRSILHSAKV